MNYEWIAEQARTLEQVIFAGYTHAPAAELAAGLAAVLPALHAEGSVPHVDDTPSSG